MQSAFKPYATAGVAIVGASLLAVAPVAPPLPDLQPRDVVLTAGSPLGNLLAPWIDEYNTAAGNLTQLTNNALLAPGVGMQQAMVNVSNFVQQILDDPAAIPQVAAQLRDDMQAVMSSFTLLDVDQATFDTTVKHTLDAGLISHLTMFSSLPGLLPPGLDVDLIRPLVNFTASPLSGILMGALGPSISPWVALMNSLNDGDDFNETLAHMVGAYFNGATLNLDPLLPLINGMGLLPAPTSLEHLDIAFGGILSPGVVGADPYHLYDSTGATIATITPVGGSMLNSIGLTLAGVPGVGEVPIHSHAVGPSAAWEGLSQLTGILLGDNWDGKNAPAFPPGVGIDFPTIPVDIFDGDPGGGAATDLMSEILAGLGWDA